MATSAFLEHSSDYTVFTTYVRRRAVVLSCVHFRGRFGSLIIVSLRLEPYNWCAIQPNFVVMVLFAHGLLATLAAFVSFRAFASLLRDYVISSRATSDRGEFLLLRTRSLAHTLCFSDSFLPFFALYVARA